MYKKTCCIALYMYLYVYMEGRTWKNEMNILDMAKLDLVVLTLLRHSVLRNQS